MAETLENEDEISTIRSTVEEAYDRIEESDNKADDPPAEPAPVDLAATPTAPIIPADTNIADPADPPAEPAPVDTIAYPEHWDPAFKDEFTAAPPGVQKFLMERHKSMEADYTRKTMENADFMRDYAPIKQILAPFSQSMQQDNIPPSELIRRWAVAENHLNTNPEQALMQIAQHYNVDLVALADSTYQQNPSAQPPIVDPMVQNLTNQVNTLQTTINGQQTSQNEAQIKTFVNEKTEAGQPAHPYFDEVIPDMMQLIVFERSQGRSPGLNDLYEKACRMNTSVFDKMIASQKNADATHLTAQQAAADAETEARLKAKQATDAASSVSGDPGANVSASKNPPTSIRSAVLDAWDKNSH